MNVAGGGRSGTVRAVRRPTRGVATHRTSVRWNGHAKQSAAQALGKQLAEVITTMDFQSHDVASETSCGSSADDGSVVADNRDGIRQSFRVSVRRSVAARGEKEMDDAAANA
jgi:hypothetical protein